MRERQRSRRPHETGVVVIAFGGRDRGVPLRGAGDVVHRRELRHPRKALREGGRVFGEQGGKIVARDVAHPARHAAVTEVGDRRDAEQAQALHRLGARLPVESVRSDVRAIVGRPIEQRADSELVREREVVFPLGVMAAPIHLVRANTPREERGARIDRRAEVKGHRLRSQVSRVAQPAMGEAVTAQDDDPQCDASTNISLWTNCANLLGTTT